MINPDLEVVYFGKKFYRESGTMMSSLYLLEGSRYDYGLLENALENGMTVLIRPATSEEFMVKQKQLDSLKKEKE